MEFVDECRIHVRGGDGGDGAVSFRREAHVPHGGPDGGDGGRGGDVALVAEEGLSSLLHLHRNPHRRGEDGSPGSGGHRTGADGADEELAVPAGTVVREEDSGRLVADLASAGERVVVAEGGRGGRGNARFSNRYRRLPEFAEYGEQVTERSLRLELKLIADAGLVGFPSAGKSTLISRMSAATPRVESWPFTTVTPHLGVMVAGEAGEAGRDIVLADVPGLIAGASEGRGLGHQFLRHVERCLVLVHVLDAAAFDPERDPVSDLDVILGELESHDPTLDERPRLLVINKVDLPDGRAMAEMTTPVLEDRGEEVLWVSAVTGEGVDQLRYRLAELVTAERERTGGRRRPVQQVGGPGQVIRLEPEQPRVRIATDPDGRYHVLSERCDRWVQMTPLDNPQAVRYLQGRLRRAGVEAALVDAGARSGDEVVVGGVVFDFEPELSDLPEEERVAVMAGELDDEAEVGEIELVEGDEDREVG